MFDIVAVVQADRDEAQACPEPKDEQDNEENPGECAELIVDPGHHILATFRAEGLLGPGIEALLLVDIDIVGLDRRRYFHWLLRRIRLCIRLRRIRLIDFCHLVIDHGIVVAEFMFVGNDN